MIICDKKIVRIPLRIGTLERDNMRLRGMLRVKRQRVDRLWHTLMSSSDSVITYVSISSEDVPFWGIRFFGLEQPDSPEAAHKPMYPEYIPLEDEHMLPAEEQPLPLVVSPTAQSPRYVVESDPKEYEDDESEDGSVDYPMEGGDDDDGYPSGDDANDEDEDEEEEHLASADSTVVVPTVEPVSPPEKTEPVIPPPSTDITTTRARITIRLQASISLPLEAEVERLLAMPTPPPSPLISLSPPSAKECLARCTALYAHSSPPPVPSPLLPTSGCPT
nr:hypothetical protein [Tanacetum cinerariifolium]